MYEPRYVRATVTGEVPIRDVFTRESVEQGGQVTLLVREAGTQKPPRCPRHPKKGAQDDAKPCYCGGTVVDWLVKDGAIGDVQDFDPNKPAAGKGKA